MSDQPVAVEPPSAPKVYERKTRAPDWLTDVVLVITGIFGVWAVGLVALTFIGILQPAFYYNDTKAAIKAAGSTVVVLLTFSQFYTMESVLGHLPRGRIKMRSMMRVHRCGRAHCHPAGGRHRVLLHGRRRCANQPLRVVVHIVAGSTAFALLAIKFALIRWKPYLAYDTAPWIGRIVAVCFIAIWVTSGFAYFTGNSSCLTNRGNYI